MINIVNFEDRHAAAFKLLNLEWLEKYQLAESHDLMVLDDPRGTIIDRGGYIFLAVEGEEVIGSVALMREAPVSYELAKMAVAPAYRGRGISKLLLDHCLTIAKHIKATRISLFSNDQLTTALRLYRQYGFKDIPVTGSPFTTANVKMELLLN